MGADPRNFQDVQYLIVIEYGYSLKGSYDCGTKAIQEEAQISCYTANSTVSSVYEHVLGWNPPFMLSYSGTPPTYKSGGAPQIQSALARILFALIDA